MRTASHARAWMDAISRQPTVPQAAKVGAASPRVRRVVQDPAINDRLCVGVAQHAPTVLQRHIISRRASASISQGKPDEGRTASQPRAADRRQAVDSSCSPDFCPLWPVHTPHRNGFVNGDSVREVAGHNFAAGGIDAVGNEHFVADYREVDGILNVGRSLVPGFKWGDVGSGEGDVPRRCYTV